MGSAAAPLAVYRLYLFVTFNGVAVFKHRYANWMGLLAVAALALMFFTDMYLFALPYVAKWRSERRAD